MNDERLNFSENFAKSKRNLLWIFTIIIFVYLAKLPRIVDIKIVDVNFPVARSYLILLASAYFFYLLFSYFHELYFSYRRNSEAGRTLEELDAKDFVDRSILEISGSMDILKQNIRDIENLKSNLPSDEPVAIDAINFTHHSLDSVRNSMELVYQNAQQRVHEQTAKLIELYGRDDDILEFSNETTRLFYAAAQQMVNNFLTVKLEMTKIQKLNDVEEAEKRFAERMELLNSDLANIKKRLNVNSILIVKSAQSFLGISKSVHFVSKTSFFILDGMIPISLSIISIAIILDLLF